MSDNLMKTSENNGVEQRKFFANKKANIAMIAGGVAIIVAIIGVAIWANI
jgi:flagellar biogenesis protein FliO